MALEKVIDMMLWDVSKSESLTLIDRNNFFPISLPTGTSALTVTLITISVLYLDHSDASSELKKKNYI